MNTEIKDFPRGKKVEDFLYLIWQELAKGRKSRYEVSDITSIAGSVLDGKIVYCFHETVSFGSNFFIHLYTPQWGGVRPADRGCICPY